ncbi:MAG: lipopolysaccharide biosynthesis protein RfbH [Endomicrobia bacterium]|nr:lipopolysaccharide biosynthesis protein RfbH [Endomicrobiia bacterium]
MTKETLKKQILNLTGKYAENFLAPKKYMPGDKISYAGRVFDKNEVGNLVDSALEFWLTSGRYTNMFETELAKFLNIRHCLFVNSGSSANLLAFMALTSPILKEKAIKRGDEVITAAAAFPTTVAPIIQYGAVPVFIDITIPQYNIDVNSLKKALTKKTKAVMIAHTLGNPFDLKAIGAFCKKNNLWLIEDNCDALGSKYKLNGKWHYTGTIGDIGTSSFYPPHHITTGEGGAVYTNNTLLNKIMLSLRDWGRDCSFPSVGDNFCGHRFGGQFGMLPKGYDHKYIYSNFGYNLKATEMQAAIGCAQLKKLPSFIKKRKNNWKFLYNKLKPLSDKLILPQKAENSDPSWFAFLITVKNSSKAARNEIVRFLEQNGIQTRMLFAGNLIKHPCFGLIKNNKSSYRTAENLKNTDFIMNHAFWVGIYPGMTKEKLTYMAEKIKEAVL